jgi:hypothetical protein
MMLKNKDDVNRLRFMKLKVEKKTFLSRREFFWDARCEMRMFI